MARPLRISFEGAWYHVMNRGAAKKNIFHSDIERHIFLDLLERIHCRYKIEIHSYCLMDNHYHLLVRTPLPNISHAIKYLDGVYAQKFNFINNIDGPLFRGRFKTKLVDDDEYLTHLTRYIHLNPIEASMCNNPWEYRWSSCSNYLGLTRKRSWLYVDEILNRFQSGLKDKYYNYLKFILDANNTDLMELFFKKKIPVIAGGEFIKNINQNLLDKPVHDEIPEDRLLRNLTLPSLDKVVSSVCMHFNISEDDIYQSRINPSVRNIIIYLAIEVCNMKLGEVVGIFENIGKTRVSTIHKNMLRDIQNDEQLKIEIGQIVRACGK